MYDNTNTFMKTFSQLKKKATCMIYEIWGMIEEVISVSLSSFPSFMQSGGSVPLSQTRRIHDLDGQKPWFSIIICFSLTHRKEKWALEILHCRQQEKQSLLNETWLRFPFYV